MITHSGSAEDPAGQNLGIHLDSTSSSLRRLIDHVPRADRSHPGCDLDTSLPVMLLAVSQSLLQHSSLGIFRTLGRAGVPVNAVVYEGSSPVGFSRYLDSKILWQPQCGETFEDLLPRLIDFGRQLGRRSLIVCNGDEMALFVAQHRAALAEYYVIPNVPAELPAQLVNKGTLHELCRLHGVATPRTTRVETMRELLATLAAQEPPWVVKSTAPSGTRVVENTLVFGDRNSLEEMSANWSEPYSAVIQDFIPDHESQDWFTHGYCGADSTPKIIFTGEKVRSWPVHGGATAAGFVAANDELAMLSARFCTALGYQGIFDLDWRLDLRTGTYYLLDFNPRVGAQFRMFETDAGVDVVRAMHLDLSGRAIPAGTAVDGERFIVEPSDLASLIANRRHPEPWTGGCGRPRAAWLAKDDPLPVAVMVARQLAHSIRKRLPSVG